MLKRGAVDPNRSFAIRYECAAKSFLGMRFPSVTRQPVFLNLSATLRLRETNAGSRLIVDANGVLLDLVIDAS
jgi:hypothetical protein